MLSIILIIIKYFQYKNELMDSKKLFFLSIFTIFNPYFYIHMYSGIETFIFMFVLFDVLYLSTRFNTEISERKIKYFYFTLLLLPLIRPEEALFSIFSFITFVYSKNFKISNKIYLLVIILIGLIYFIFRYKYFGFIFPNTYYAKRLESPWALLNMKHFMVHDFKIILLAYILAFLGNKKNIIVVSYVFFIAALSYANSRLLSNFADRFTFQVYIPLLAFLAIQIQSKTNIIIYSLSCVFSIFVIYKKLNSSHIIDIGIFSWPKSLQVHGCIANKINIPKILLGDVGLIPYLTNSNTFDMNGLANLSAAHRLLKNNEIKEFSPDIFIFYASAPKESTIGDSSVNQLRFYNISKNMGYKFVTGLKYTDDYYLNIFINPSNPKYNDLKSRFEDCSKTAENKIFNFNDSNFLRDFLSFKYLGLPLNK